MSSRAYAQRMAATASTSVMVGRAAERGVLDDLLRAVAQGAGAAVFVEGEAGIGKTRVVQECADTSRGLGVTVLVGSARPFETTRPFGAVSDALELRGGSADPARAAVARLLRGDGGTRASDPDMRHRVVDEIVDLVEELTGAGPVLLILEDLHWADDSTVLVCRALLDRVADLPLLLVGTLRPSPRSAGLDSLLETVTARGRDILRLGPLSDHDIAALVHAEAGAADGSDAEVLVRRAGGNPLWVVEILRALASEELLGARSDNPAAPSGALPDSFRQLVLRRLRYLPDATLRVLPMAAVLGDSFTLVDLATVTGRRAGELLDELAPALLAELLSERGPRLAFRHQLVHDAIYQDIPLAGRVALHQDAARVLAGAGAPLAQIAAHVMRGSSASDLQAVAWLRAAALEALPQAPSVAIDILDYAQGLLPVQSSEHDLCTAELVEALLRAGRVAECASRAEAALVTTTHPEARAALRLSLLSALSLQNRAEDLIAQAQAALDARPALSDAQQALVLAQSSYGRTFGGDLLGGEADARAALELAERAEDTSTTVWSLTTLSFAVKTQGRYAEAVELTERAARAAVDGPDKQGRLRHPHFFLGMALCDADRMAEARDTYRKGVRECADLGSSWILPDIQQLTGELHFLTGEWDDALAEIEAGLGAARNQGNQVPIAQSLAYLAVIATARGDLKKARATLAPLQGQLDADSPPYGMEAVAYAVAVLAEAEGDPAAAFDVLRRFWAVDGERQCRRFDRLLAPPLVRIALAHDERAVASHVVGDLAETVRLAAEVPGLRAVLLRCRGMLDGDPEAALAAVDLAGTGSRVLEDAGACEDAAATLVACGRPAEAQPLLVRSLERYEALAATTWVARARSNLRSLGVRQGVRGPRQRPSHGWASLTTTERTVASLVADGLTNREVAARLFISPHTVNTHLRHVFQKLEVSSRVGLSAKVLRQGEYPG